MPIVCCMCMYLQRPPTAKNLKISSLFMALRVYCYVYVYIYIYFYNIRNPVVAATPPVLSHTHCIVFLYHKLLTSILIKVKYLDILRDFGDMKFPQF